jgi:hypothetical protein
LLAVSIDYKIYLWDVPTRRLVLPPLEGHRHLGLMMRFNHAGDRLLSTDWGGNWRLWDTHTGQLLLTLPAVGVTFYFSRDDRLVGAGQHGKFQLYHFRRGEELRTVVYRKPAGQSSFDSHGSPVLEPDGRLFAVATADGVALVDVTRRQVAALLPLPRNYPLCFDSAGALWTHGARGLLRWPLTVEPKTGQRSYGAPKWIISATNEQVVGSNPDARVVAIPDFGRGAIVRAKTASASCGWVRRRMCATVRSARTAGGSRPVVIVSVKGRGPRSGTPRKGSTRRICPLGAFAACGSVPMANGS